MPSSKVIAPIRSGLLLAAFLCASANAADVLVLTNFTLIDGTGAPARSVVNLIARDGIIDAIDAVEWPDPNDESDRVTTVDLDGAYVMPGLVDTHVHVARYPDTRVFAERILAAAVHGGITGVRDLGGDARTLAEIMRATNAGQFVGPTVAYSGLYGGVSLFADPRIVTFAEGYAPGTAPWTKAIAPETDLVIAIAETKGAGASGIKVYGNLDRALAAKVIREADRQGLKSWAHATVFPAGPGDLVDAGIHSLSHAPYLIWEAVDSIPDDYGARIAGPWDKIPADHPKLKALFARMVEKNVSLDATLYVYKEMNNFSPEVKADWAEAAFNWGVEVTAVAHRAGVKLTAGTDWFEPRGPDELPHTHDELALLVETAGLTPMDAVVAGTRNGAEAMGVLGERGTVEVGKAADLLVLNDNPLDDIRNTKNIRIVVKDGLVLRP